jgi:hypothetical protein
MTDFTDGPPLTLDDLQRSLPHLIPFIPGVGEAPGLVAQNGYRLLFDDLRDPASRLPETPQTADHLIALGRSMVYPNPLNQADNSNIPAVYTYFGQLIDHDLTRTVRLVGHDLQSGMLPILHSEISGVVNARSPLFDLDCIYGPPTEPGPSYDIPLRNQDKELKVEKAQDGEPDSDLPRDPIPGTHHDAFIGDRRNDEHLVLSQMHVAFLRAHNALVATGLNFDEARTELQRIYQYITINDYLPRICDPAIVEQAVAGAFPELNSAGANPRIALEFSVAAFRTCHSMIRNVYNYNEHLQAIRLFQLFMPGPLKEFNHILESWVIDWPRFFNGTNMARRISPKLAPDVVTLLNAQMPFDLATVDLLKGYLFRLPTGEAIATRLNQTPMSFAEISAVTTPEQQQALIAGNFQGRTPLWFYLLCEAAATPEKRLGTLGSIIVASIIVDLIRRTPNSYLAIPNWTPFDHGPGYELADLFQFAGVLPN